MVDTISNYTSQSVSDLNESLFQSLDFKCLSDESHSERRDCAVLNAETGKLDCRKCLIRKGKAKAIIRIGYLLSSLPTELQELLDILETTEEVIL